MIKVKNYEEISKVIFMFFKKGMVTNTFMKKEEFESEILNGSLYYFTTDAGLWIVREREEYYILNFYLTDIESDKSLKNTFDEIKQELNKTVILEVVGKSELDDNFMRVCQFFLNIGAKLYIERQRYAKKVVSDYTDICDVSNVEKDFVKIDFCEKADVERITDILKENFDKLSGCIPDKNIILEDIKYGNLYKALLDGDIAGILHIKKDNSTSEIRHLVVASEMRNKGIASNLLKYYDKNVTTKIKTVWTGKENIVAQKVYEKNGYKKDGYVSKVLCL